MLDTLPPLQQYQCKIPTKHNRVKKKKVVSLVIKSSFTGLNLRQKLDGVV